MIKLNLAEHQDHSDCDGILYFKDHAIVPVDLNLQTLILTEFHNSPVSGHTGIQRTLTRIARIFFWLELMQSIHKFVAQCVIWQSIKPFDTSPQGGLQPLPILGQIWHVVSMDFITHLLPSLGKTTIMILINQPFKQSYFFFPESQFIASHVANLFAKDVVRLHGVLANSVLDQDPLFMRFFLVRALQNSRNNFSNDWAYYPQSDRQTKALNKYFEDYLQCFVANEPHHLLQYLHWRE